MNVGLHLSVKWFCMCPLRMFRSLQIFPTSSATTERNCSCFDGSCNPSFFSGEDKATFLELLELPNFLSTLSVCFDLRAPVSWLIEEHSLVESLGHIRLLNLSRLTPIAWMLVRLLISDRHSPDWPEIPNFVKRFPHSSGREPPNMPSLSPSENLHSKSSSNLFSTWCSAFLTWSRARKSLTWLQNTSRKSKYWINKKLTHTKGQ